MSARMLSERREACLVLTLSDPPTRNSLSPAACAAGVDALAAARDDPSVRAVILRGDGGHFCGGGNLQRLQAVRDGPLEAQTASMQPMLDFVAALAALPKPVIAAVEGFAAGAGASLVLACDLAVAADDARFVFSYGRVGLSPDAGSTWHLARRLPRPLALQMLWLPEPMTAAQWQAHGLVNALAPAGHALDTALQWARRLSAMAPGAVASAKALLDSAAAQPLSAQLDLEREHFVRHLFGDDAGEGIRAFLDKRAPVFGASAPA